MGVSSLFHHLDQCSAEDDPPVLLLLYTTIFLGPISLDLLGLGQKVVPKGFQQLWIVEREEMSQ